MANLTGRSIAPKEVGRIKQKTCKACRNKFSPTKPMQSVCDWKCGAEWAKTQREKKERAELREAKIKIKSRGDWMKEAQASFNRWVRLRDDGLPCISCGSSNRSSWDAGHYRARSVAPALRFHPENVHRQCVQCNQHQHGNLIEFRLGLTQRIGIERVEWLEGKHEPMHYSIQDLIEIKAKYSKLARELEKQLENRS